jgi:hypothetical protein
MSTVLGIVIGVVATIIVGHYYFKRTTNKSIAVYLTLNSRIFAGIESSVREQLKFYFHDSEVRDLSQIEFIIANDGERAIRDCIEPLSLQMPVGVEILDASILYRKPEQLIADVEQNISTIGVAQLRFRFPLLNQGDFFLVKLLLNGSLKRDDLEFHILADDLPRAIKAKRLPAQSTTTAKPRVEWSGVVVGGILVLLGLSQAYAMYLLYRASPQFFPLPWASFKPSALAILVLIVWSVGIIGTLGLGTALFALAGFDEFFQRHPRFPLPSELRHHHHRIFVRDSEGEFSLIRDALIDEPEQQKEKVRKE